TLEREALFHRSVKLIKHCVFITLMIIGFAEQITFLGAEEFKDFRARHLNTDKEIRNQCDVEPESSPEYITQCKSDSNPEITLLAPIAQEVAYVNRLHKENRIGGKESIRF